MGVLSRDRVEKGNSLSSPKIYVRTLRLDVQENLHDKSRENSILYIEFVTRFELI